MVASAILTLVAFVLTLGIVLAIGNRQPSLQQGLMLALAANLLSLSNALIPRSATRVPAWPTIGRRSHVLAGGLLVMLGCAIAAIGGRTGWDNFNALFYAGLLTYGAGIILIFIGLAIATEWRPGRTLTRWWDGLRGQPRETVAVFLVLSVGLVFRVYQLGYFPPPDGFAIVDEPQIGGGATQHLRYGIHPWNYPELIYPAALSFKLFGASILTLRYPNVLAGFLLLPVFYAFARQFFSRPAALVGTALLAVSRWEIAYTRLVLPSCTMMLAEVTVFLLAMRAIRGHATYASYALMGLLLGEGLYSHVSFRLVPIILFLWGVGFLVLERRQLGAILRRHVPGWFLMAIIAIITALPYIGITRREAGVFSERFTSIMPLLFNPGGMSNPGGVLSNHVQALFGYFVGPGDGWLAVNIPDAPMLDPITATLFLLGLGYALLNVHRPYILMILSWLGITLLTGAILTLDFRPERFIACLPPVFLLTCVSAEVVVQRIHAASRRVMMVVIAATVIAFVLASSANANELYNTLSHNPAARNTFDPPAVDTVQYFRGVGRNAPNYLLAEFPFPGVGSDWGWMAGDPAGRQPEDLGDALPVHDPIAGSRMHTMIAEPYPLQPVASAFKSIYPGAAIRDWSNTSTGNRYSTVTVSTSEIARGQGLNGPCPRPSLCHPNPRARMPQLRRTYWTGSLYIPTEGRYRLHAFGPTGAEDVAKVEGRQPMNGISLHVGWYSVRIQTSDATMPSLQWTGPNVSGVIPLSDLRNTLAHGLLQRFLPLTPTSTDIAPARRVPFPFFLYLYGHNGGRPWTPQQRFPYRSTLTGILSPGHAGTYDTILYSVGARLRSCSMARR